MLEEEYQRQLQNLRKDWGSVHITPDPIGCVRAAKDSTAGFIVGMRAPLLTEIINRALSGEYDQR